MRKFSFKEKDPLFTCNKELLSVIKINMYKAAFGI
jgi:hypothetical protein